MQGKLQRDISKLRDDTLRLSLQVDIAIAEAMNALHGHDVSLARQVIAGDADINHLRYHIEQECYMLLAMQQPTARDMRSLVAIIHISVELKRIADHAVEIAKLTIQLVQETTYKVMDDLLQMATIIRGMLKESMDAYLHWDSEMAREIATRDDQVDKLDKLIYKHLLAAMIADSTWVNAGTHLLWTSHNLERMADHVSNICERVIFMVTGEIPEA